MNVCIHELAAYDAVFFNSVASWEVETSQKTALYRLYYMNAYSQLPINITSPSYELYDMNASCMCVCMYVCICSPTTLLYET